MPASPLSMPGTTSRRPRRKASGDRLLLRESNTVPSLNAPSYRIFTVFPSPGSGPDPIIVSFTVSPPPKCFA